MRHLHHLTCVNDECEFLSLSHYNGQVEVVAFLKIGTILRMGEGLAPSTVEKGHFNILKFTKYFAINKGINELQMRDIVLKNQVIMIIMKSQLIFSFCLFSPAGVISFLSK